MTIIKSYFVCRLCNIGLHLPVLWYEMSKIPLSNSCCALSSSLGVTKVSRHLLVFSSRDRGSFGRKMLVPTALFWLSKLYLPKVNEWSAIIVIVIIVVSFTF